MYVAAHKSHLMGRSENFRYHTACQANLPCGTLGFLMSRLKVNNDLFYVSSRLVVRKLYKLKGHFLTLAKGRGSYSIKA